MVRSQRLRSVVRSTPLLLMLAVGGVATAIGISSPGLSLPSASGGSIRDNEVIAAADGLGLAMVFTGMRHFRH